MPSIVLRNKDPKVPLWPVENVPDQMLDAFLAAHEPGGWVLDKKSDPAQVALDAAQTAATNNQES